VKVRFEPPGTGTKAALGKFASELVDLHGRPTQDIQLSGSMRSTIRRFRGSDSAQ
jgi:hypothetical protein